MRIKALEAIGEVSLDDKAYMVRSAYMDSVPMGDAPDTSVMEIFDEYLIICQSGKYFKVLYTVGTDASGGSAVTFGSPIEVMMQYVPVSEALEFIGEPRGKKWEVRVIREGVSKKNFIYTRHALESLLPFITGAKVLAIEVFPGVHGHAPEGRAVAKEEVGTLINPRGVEVDGLYEVRAELEVRGSWIDRLKSLVKKVGTGLSINAPVEGFRVKEALVWVKKFLGLESVDLATLPSAGGSFLRATENRDAEGEGDEDMKQEEVISLVKTLIAQETQDLTAALQKDGNRAYLTLKLAECNLPEPAKELISKKYSTGIFAREALDQDLTAVKEMLDKLAQSGHVIGVGDTRIEISREAVDRVQIALDKTFGVKVEGHSDVKTFKGLRHAYVQITGDSDITGHLPAHRMRSQEAINSSDFPNLLAATMNKRLVQDYREANYNENIFISFVGSAADFKLQEANRVGYFSDVPILDPEAEDYNEAAKPGEENVQYRVETRGELVKLTRKTLINDDLAGVVKRIRGRGRAYRRTYARYIWSFYLNNKTYDGDGTAWFTAGGGSHGNLITNVIAYDKITSLVTAIKDMTEPDSGEKLGLAQDQMSRLKLIVGHALEWTAKALNQQQYLDGISTPNPVWRMFGDNNERIIVSPLETDANDWGIICDPSDREIIEVKFLNGQQEPEFFIADQPGFGEMLIRDTLVFKDRHEYGAELVDYRNGAKSIVA